VSGSKTIPIVLHFSLSSPQVQLHDSSVQETLSPLTLLTKYGIYDGLFSSKFCCSKFNCPELQLFLSHFSSQEQVSGLKDPPIISHFSLSSPQLQEFGHS
jgi:hypothetical protein